MKVIIPLFLISIILGSSQVKKSSKIDEDNVERKALEMAFKIIKIYYPQNILIVNDSLFDSYDYGFEKDVNESTKSFLINYRKSKRFEWDEPQYSTYLSEMNLNNSKDVNQPDFEVQFSLMSNNLIYGEVYPFSVRYGEVTCFLFKYNLEGLIYESFMEKMIVDF